MIFSDGPGQEASAFVDRTRDDDVIAQANGWTAWGFFGEVDCSAHTIHCFIRSRVIWRVLSSKDSTPIFSTGNYLHDFDASFTKHFL